MSGKTLVTGAGGFIGGHLVRALLEDGAEVRAVDVKPHEEWYQRFDDSEALALDLRDLDACARAVAGVDRVYNLAADMGGWASSSTTRPRCMLSVLINTHLLADRSRAPESSDTCLRRRRASTRRTGRTLPDVTALREGDAYPAMPEDGYGWEKLFSERMCRHFREDYGLATRVARYHNVYGPNGTFEGGREKAPAAICRKVANAKLSGEHEIEVWGDGEQTRSFMYIDDCLRGTLLIMDSEVVEPLNVGLQRAGHDQRADRHRGADRRDLGAPELRPLRARRGSAAATATTP